jgi:2-polyprenyl-3-methyl-5-hydroxy-6-metoxy-1,4-benzoquinol methylase
MVNNAFNKSGFASTDDLTSPEYLKCLSALEEQQEQFLAIDPHSSQYIWPKDSLHTWSRIWEYPYVYHHLMNLQRQNRLPVGSLVMDFGCGVTFFPFVLARLGFQVLCLDNDPVCIRDLQHAAERLTAGALVGSRLMSGELLPVESGSVRCIYSVSVLEHLGEPASIIAELARVLTRDGTLVMTIDVDMTGSDHGIGVARYGRLIQAIQREFDFDMPHVPTHPLALNSRGGQYPMRSALSGWRAVLFELKQQVAKPLLGRTPTTWPHLACEGFVLRKRRE